MIMSDKKKDLLYLSALLALLILFFSKILFTGQIVRAPDITNEFYWTVQGFKSMRFLDLFRVHLQPGWDIYMNGGTTEGGGTLSMQFLFYRSLIFRLIPAPANVAWFMVLHLFFGGAGTYLYCRAIGADRLASFLGGLIFAVAPENASLINAGHVQKIATISFAPWAFYFLEKGFQRRRLIWFLTTGVVLALQFFNMHWQIAYYTCLGIGAYCAIRTVGILKEEWRKDTAGSLRLIGLNLATALFFLSTAAISLVPLADWSKDTNRGVQSGANQGKGGLAVDEAMSWSLPPEEAATLVIPGLFGFSRQEGAYDSADIESYYWGRTVFTQTSDYMGLLPWLLLPLPLLFRRDRITWIAVAAVAGGLIFSMGKYTPFYRLLFEHFPGINHFRVPKMMMFLPVLGVAVLAARGVDLLLDEQVRKTTVFRRYLIGILCFPLLLLVMEAAGIVGKDFWTSTFYDMLARPTRFEQGAYLVQQRWHNLITEIALAAGFSAAFALILRAFSKYRTKATLLSVVLIALYSADAWRVDNKFMLLQDVPAKANGATTPAIRFFTGKSRQYRALPLDGTDPMQYVSHCVPVMFTSNAVQQQRWQDFLGRFNFSSAMPDLMNVKYLVLQPEQYRESREQLGKKYVPVFAEDREIVLENRSVLPKAWLVPTVTTVMDPTEGLELLQKPEFDPRSTALVETPPPIPLDGGHREKTGSAVVAKYHHNHINIIADTPQNALLVLGEKYFRGWQATVDGKEVRIYPVNHVLRGVYLTGGKHSVQFRYDPLPFKIGKWLSLLSLVFFVVMVDREIWLRRKTGPAAGP